MTTAVKTLKVVGNVYETTDYSIFNHLEGNRIVNEVHVKRLIKSMQKKHLVCPIMVNEHMEVIDGQHRFNACQELGLPIYYIINEGYSLEDVQLLNTNMKNWNKQDYLNAYCDLGNEEYLKFRDFMDEFPEFGIACIEIILTQRSRDRVIQKEGVRMGNRSFQEGKLEIKNLAQSRKIAKQIMKVKQYYNGFNRRSFVSTMIGLLKNESYSHKRFLHKLSLGKRSLKHCANVGLYRFEIEEIYNYAANASDLISLRYL